MPKVKDIEPLLNKLFASYPNNKPSRETLGTYVQFVADIPLSELEVVINQCLLDFPTFCPTPGNLRNCWIELTSPRQLSADEAWLRVRQAFSRCGHTKFPDFDNEHITAVVRALGWYELCVSDNIAADRAHFMRMYQERIERVRRERAYLPASRRLLTAHQTEVPALPAPRAALPEPVEPVQYKSAVGFEPVGNFLSKLTQRKEEEKDAGSST